MIHICKRIFVNILWWIPGQDFVVLHSLLILAKVSLIKEMVPVGNTYKRNRHKECKAGVTVV